MAQMKICAGPSWLAIRSQVDLLKPKSLRLLGSFDPTSICVHSFCDLCEDRSPGCGQRSVARLRVGLRVGLGRGSGSEGLSSKPHFRAQAS